MARGIREGYEHLTEKEIRFGKQLDVLNAGHRDVLRQAVCMADELGLSRKDAAVIFAGWSQAAFLLLPEPQEKG